MRKSTMLFAVIVLVAAVFAVKFSHHPIAWLIGLAVSIPIFAAVAGAFLQSDQKSH